METLARYLGWQASVRLETPFSVSYCLNRLKTGLHVDNHYWKQPYTLDVVHLDPSTYACDALIRGTWGIPSAHVHLQLYPVDTTTTHLEVGIKTARVIRVWLLLVEVPTFLISLVFLPCALFVVLFYLVAHALAMRDLRVLIVEALEQSLGIASVIGPPLPKSKRSKGS